jgi:hypothetical protein
LLYTASAFAVNVPGMDLLRRYWGIPALLLAVGCWVGLVAGKLAASIVGMILVLSAAAVGYFLFQAPLWCGAVTRDGTLCRNNSSGLLIGCHLRQHKWQKLKLAIIPRAWGELNRGLWATPRDGVTTLGGMGSAVSALAAVVVILVR